MKIKTFLLEKHLFFKESLTPELELKIYHLNNEKFSLDFTTNELDQNCFYELFDNKKIENLEYLFNELQLDLNDPFCYTNYCYLQHGNYFIVFIYGEIQPQLWELSLEAVFEKE
ncbi:hypothetical protein [Flammeovirga kamogawensis]|uniref:Uncharacterized protein n=1 Tax=Flammeovirga kamogawensis TaxID=373891 RepID=A0ABX8H314_9BACT|nr:hypothetical protein [Flammeovirga kamogawensis]MBB6460288.1 hypothetical protein [Flammeovirga kamogawensis]QWG10098.1 hypothetical protein KM029_20665 [Flammeovirga kamogawensis]TRX65605.1 hypothetical protein EO216_24095 [Flammeovirga kamogawensis]